MRRLNLQERETRECLFWETSANESPASDSVENIVNKAWEAKVFLEKLAAFHPLFAAAQQILEVGAGQCWASCIIKKKFPGAAVTATDISAAAIASAPKWEHIYRVKLDRVLSCKSYQLPFPSANFDLVFTFASAHHFADHDATLRELRRVLHPDGCALYFREPACRPWQYRPFLWRANAKRPECPEDVLIPSRLAEMARRNGLAMVSRADPSLSARGPIETLYYMVLSSLPGLTRLLPCTTDFIFRPIASR